MVVCLDLNLDKKWSTLRVKGGMGLIAGRWLRSAPVAAYCGTHRWIAAVQ